jgi:hypothetical protein
VTTFSERLLNESIAILRLIDLDEVEALAAGLLPCGDSYPLGPSNAKDVRRSGSRMWAAVY